MAGTSRTALLFCTGTLLTFLFVVEMAIAVDPASPIPGAQGPAASVAIDEPVVGDTGTTISGVTNPDPGQEGEVENEYVNDEVPRALHPEVVIMGH